MERLKLRFFREAGVERWKVFAIASALPLLLQFALLFFFIGLAFFFHQLDTVVAWFTAGTEILWLGSLLFATLAPAFSSQCPYKTPFVKGAISRLRIKLICLPRNLAFWFLQSTSRIPSLNEWFYRLDHYLIQKQGIWESLEEGVVCQNGALSLPVVSYTRNLLQGERLWDSVEECIRGISDKDIEEAEEGIRVQSPHLHRMLPYIQDGSVKAVGSFLIDAAEDSRLQPIYFGQEIRPCLYFALTRLQGKAYTPGDFVIPSHSIPAFIHLIQANTTSAAFSFLSMYSIRHHTVKEYPDSFDNLFLVFSTSEILSHGIGKLTFSSLSPVQLIKTYRGPIPIEPTRSDKIPHSLHLEPAARRVG